MDTKSQPKGMTFRLPPDEDASRPLLDPTDLEQRPTPTLSLTFSTVQLLRVPIIPLAIADAAVMGHCRHHVGAGVFFELFPVGLCLWTLVNLVASLGTGRRDRFELRLGEYVCFIGKRGKAEGRCALPKRLARPYLTMAGDLLLCVLFIIPTVLAKKEHVWEWRWCDRVFGLSLTLCILQLIVAFLSFFSHCRRAKVVVYAAEDDEKMEYAVPDRQVYMDADEHDAEPRPSTSSLV